MMIVMKAGATEAEIESVIHRIESVGARAHPSRGEEVTVIGAIGDREHGARLRPEGAPAGGPRPPPPGGEEAPVTGARGAREHAARLGLEGAPGVAQVVPILKPYKLA